MKKYNKFMKRADNDYKAPYAYKTRYKVVSKSIGITRNSVDRNNLKTSIDKKHRQSIGTNRCKSSINFGKQVERVEPKVDRPALNLDYTGSVVDQRGWRTQNNFTFKK